MGFCCLYCSIIKNFLESYKSLYKLAKDIVGALKGRDLNSKAYNAETEKLLDELNLCKSGFNSLFEDTWHTLMGFEMQLFERTEVLQPEALSSERW